nr:hypothetical protein [Tanacetum cinerariifolium]
MVVQNQAEMGKGLAMPTDPHHIPTIVQQSPTQPQKTKKPRKPKRKNTKIPQPSGSTKNVADEDVYNERGDGLMRAATTASNTRSKATPNESSFLETTLGGGPRCQEAMGDTIDQTRFERVSKLFNDLLLVRGNTLRSDEDRIKLKELMGLCTTLQTRVIDLEKTKTTQQMEIDSLKRRVNKLEKSKRSRTHRLKRLYKVGLTARVESSDEQSLGKDASKQGRKINDIDADENTTLVNIDDTQMFDVNANLGGEEVFVEKQNENVTITTEEVTLA